MPEDFTIEWVRDASMEIRKLRAMKAMVENLLIKAPRGSDMRFALEAAVHAYAVTA
jgi:hypothetical protein